MLPVLRNIELNFDRNPLKSHVPFDGSSTPIDHRIIVLELIRVNAPSLQCLTLWWHDILLLTKSHSPWPSVRQLNVLLRTHKKDDPPASLIGRLPTNKAFPQLRYLSFGGRRFRLMPSQLMAERILAWFNALILSSSILSILHVNRRCGPERAVPPSSRDMLITLLKQHVRLSEQHHPPARVVIDSNEEIIIWL